MLSISTQFLSNKSRHVTVDGYRSKLVNVVPSMAVFFTSAHRRSVAVLCIGYMIRCNPMHHLYGALPVSYMPVQVTRGAHIGKLMRLLAAEPHSTAGLLFSSQCPCEITLLTLHAMVWDWPVSRAGPMHFHWPKLLDPLLSSTVFPYLLSFYMLVLLASGILTDRE